MKFEIPIVIKIKATSMDHAERIADRFMSGAAEMALNHDAELYKAVKWWEHGRPMIKAVK